MTTSTDCPVITLRPVQSLDLLAEHLSFVVGVTEVEMRTMLVALATSRPDVLAALKAGIDQARTDRDIDAVRRAQAERRPS